MKGRVPVLSLAQCLAHGRVPWKCRGATAGEPVGAVSLEAVLYTCARREVLAWEEREAEVLCQVSSLLSFSS